MKRNWFNYIGILGLLVALAAYGRVAVQEEKYTLAAPFGSHGQYSGQRWECGQ
jgi:protein-S-isoprenylcysteine O-methyltransferase Ste14